MRLSFFSRLMRLWAGAFLLAGITWGQGASHLPLEEGRNWKLASGNTPMSLQVVGVENGVSRVNWENPWVKAEFYFKPRGNQILLHGLDMGNGVAPMPPDTVYFDFDLPKGRSWSNTLGTMTVVDKGKTVKTPAGSFSDCIEIRATDQKGAHTFWTFAPGVGFVQFGQGRGAFLLTSVTPGRLPASAQAGAEQPTARVRRQQRGEGRLAQRGGSVFVGLESNPPPSEGYSKQAKKKRHDLGVTAGVTMSFLHPKWDEVEPRAGRFNWQDVDNRVEFAAANNLPVKLNLRIVDGNNRSMPSGYKNWSFDDPRLAQKLRELLARIAPRMRGQVRWIAIGNEVDHYFDHHTNEIASYARLIESVLSDVRREFPNAAFTINFSNASVKRLEDRYAPLVALCDFISYNYYPINEDFTFRKPEVVGAEMEEMIRAGRGKQVFFQELGYSSNESLGSSESQQARFLEVVLRTARAHADRVIGINFNWMSDLPQSVVDDLGRYYQLGNSANFKAFLASLGWFDRNGRPKPIWEVFQREASALRAEN